MSKAVIAGRKEQLGHEIQKIGFVCSFCSTRPGAGQSGWGSGPTGTAGIGEEAAESG
jgi:hypothetical protein